MNVDRGEFLESGYLILRQMIPADMLDALRVAYEEIVRREWPDGPNPGRPQFQPRVYGFDRHIDAVTAPALDFCMHENVLGPSRQLLQVADVGVAYLYFMRNPVRDYGPWWWHRDFSHHDGPLQGKQQDFIDNGPVHLQWNIALYDDDVLWIVPGSHVRPNTAAENRQLGAIPHTYAHGQMPQSDERHTPLPGGVPVDLKAGDGVAYANMLLHWASDYSTKHRRIIHIGTRGFGGPRHYQHGFWTHENCRHLSPANRTEYERLLALHESECAVKEATLQGVLDANEVAFRTGMASLHPGASGRLSCLIDICIEVRGAMEREEGCLGKFSAEETAVLWQRFSSLEEVLKVEGGDWMPGFLIAERVPYRIYVMPENYDMEDFVAGW